MSQYQQQQAGWEWRDQEDERLQAEIERDVSNTPASMTEQMLVDFDSIFMSDKESNQWLS